MRRWIKDPLAVLAKGAEGGLVVENGKISQLVGRGEKPQCDSTVEASQHVILPGLINTHHHFYQTLTRAHPDAINKELFDWLKALYPVWARLNPEAHRIATRLALTEMMMSGVTTSSDHHYVFPPGLDDAMDIQVDEAVKLGMRMTVTRGSMNLSVKDGGLPPDSVVQDQDTILADCERVIGKYHQRGEGAQIQIGLAPCSPFSVTRDLMRETAVLAEKHDCRLHTHLAETHDEDAFCLATFKMRPLDYLEDCGWLSSRTWLAHGIHFNDADIKRLGKHGVGICHCPTSNMTLASGRCRTCDLEAAGVPVGLGVDGSASNDASNLMEGVRHALLLNRLTYGQKVTHFDVLRWATQGSAACLGRSDIGEIAVGKQADLAMFKLDELRFSGAGDPLAALVLCGAQRADRVMIAGAWRVVDGLPVGLDLAQLRSQHGRAAKAFLNA
ncbi:8-oxoguanine deaminase [Aestuariivirga litoralis]|uniref:8-oxoguanine deaminase n=1 Tax=Aestuariivirga litoralis TaxID=2650924 RepID=UPI0018C6B167|nr:8-oxoguanine deaminase [Aestuariivirga litoralis]MBG1231419.1 8-oxoguanine deaminase [Aestuariivirga litoralis]